MAHDTPHWSHTTRLEAAPISAYLARAFVSHHLADRSLSSLLDPVRLVVSELVTNALVHSQTAVSVTLSASDTTVLLEVRDESLALPQRRAPQTGDESGRGLQIVDILSVDWGVNAGDGSKQVWASFAIDRESSNPSALSSALPAALSGGPSNSARPAGITSGLALRSE